MSGLTSQGQSAQGLDTDVHTRVPEAFPLLLSQPAVLPTLGSFLTLSTVVLHIFVTCAL